MSEDKAPEQGFEQLQHFLADFMPHGGADVDSGAFNAFFRFPVRLFVSPLPFCVFLLVLSPAALQAQVGEDCVTVWEGEQPGRTDRHLL